VERDSPDASALGLGSEVLRLFDELRHEILDVVRKADEIAEQSGEAGNSARAHLRAARWAVDLSRLNLVVVGGEGQGKSTLINAILGVAVTPEDASQPGTVAPVFITQGVSAIPVHSVQIGDVDPPRTVDQAEFRKLLLQATNRDNVEDVRAGYVQMRHVFLQRGLRIVDMPGIEGISPRIADDAKAFIKANANVVIGVVRRAGGFGPMARIMKEMLPPGAEPEALIFNSDTMDWNQSPSQTKEEAVLGQYVEDQRKIVARQMVKSWPGLGDHPERVFVLHLPSFNARQNGDAAQEWIKSPVHDREAERFLTWLWAHIRTHGVSEVIGGAVQKAEAAVRELKVWVQLRQRLLAALTGDGRHLVVLRTDFAAARATAQARWDQATHEAVLAQRCDQSWNAMIPSLIGAREKLVEAIRRVRQNAEGSGEQNLSDDFVRLIKVELDRMATIANERIDAAQRKELDAQLGLLLSDANKILDEVNRQFPLIRETIGTLAIDSESIVRLKMGNIDATTIERLLHGVGVAGTAALGGAAAGSAKIALLVAIAPVLGPIAALAAGATLTGVVAHTIITRLRDPNRRGLLRELDDLERRVGTIDTSQHGPLRATWGQLLAEMVETVGQLLEARLGSIAAVLDDPDVNQGGLILQRNEVGRLRQEIEAVERRLNTIAERSATPDVALACDESA
jgi:hypothetical protein